MKRFLSVVFLLLLTSFCFSDGKKENPTPAQSLDELRRQLEKILNDTHTPGVSIAIVHREEAEWVTALGKMDVAQNRAATADTVFRIGSTSKAFTALAILMLADQGKLSLDDPVHKLAPEVWFENPWESTDPIRVVNLLEHTTGWDDMHLREYAKDAAPTMGLREALDYDRHSRISRWRPGTRAAYCNTGPAVAAYIVEKVSGQRFEDFVQQNLFTPMGMKTATYLPPRAGTATTLYHGDGNTPYPYWNILYRPAGSINASANDMATYLQFYLNRGVANGKQVVPPSCIDRMENPTSTWAAREGLKPGYGLHNYWSFHEGFAYHGHNGGVEGGLTEMAYMPEYGVGYFFSINAGNGDAFDKIGKAIRAYMTRNLQKPALPSEQPLPAEAADYAGWYEPNSPRIERLRFMERLLGLSRVGFNGGKLTISNLGSRNDTFVSVGNRQFRYLPNKEAPEPVSSAILLAPNVEGRFIQAGGMTTLRRIPTALALLEIVLTAFVLLSTLSILFYAPFWVLGGLSTARRRPAERAMRLWPLLAVLCLIAFIAIFIVCSDNIIGRMGNLTVWSAALCLTTILFAVATVLSALAVTRAPADGVRRSVRRFSGIVTVGLLLLAAYLGYWGMIGLRTWV